MGLLAVVRKVVTAPMRLIEKVRGHGSGGSEAGRWLLVGLGNPGSRFEGTRHNAGFDVLDILARTEGISWTDASRHRAKVGVGKIAGVPVLLAKPQTYMNLSGESVRSLCRWYKIPNSNLLVVYDDLDTAVGAIKLKGKGGHGGHNGIRNIIDEVCGDKVFARLKFGIGRPKGGVEVYDHAYQVRGRGDDGAGEQGDVDQGVRRSEGGSHGWAGQGDVGGQHRAQGTQTREA